MSWPIDILVGDVRERLRELPADHFDCVVTSPPYWGLRDYKTAKWVGGDPACDHRSPTMKPSRNEQRAALAGSSATNSAQLLLAHRSACGKCGAVKVDAQIGLEPTLGEHLAVMVEVMREVRRVLKPSGVCFINYGDCYATSVNGRSAADTKALGADDRTFRDKPFSTVGPIFGEQRALACDTDGIAGPGSPGCGSPSQNRDGGRKGSRSSHTPDSDLRRALEQVREPLRRTQAHMESLLGRLPISGCSDLTKLQLSAAATLDHALCVQRELGTLLDALASTTPEFSEPLLVGFPLSDMISLCRSSLRSFEIGAQRFADKSVAEQETLDCRVSIASPSEELAHCIRCTAGYCSMLSAWLHSTDFGSCTPILKPKDLAMVPNRLAIALQEDGWWVRSEIIWAKPNPMPESIKDRPATSHEKIYLLAKSGETTGYRARDTNVWNLSPDLLERLPAPKEDDPHATVNRWRACDYFYDAEAVRQAGSDTSHGGTPNQGGPKQERLGQNQGGRLGVPAKSKKQAASAAVMPDASRARRVAGFNERWDAKEASRRDSFAQAHKASAGDHGQKPQHRPDRDATAYPRGEGRNLRNYEPAPVQVWKMATAALSEAHFATFPPELAERCIRAGCPEGGIVLDPFGGAGTTGLVAWRLQRACTLIELNPEYAEITRRRLEVDQGIWADITTRAPAADPAEDAA